MMKNRQHDRILQRYIYPTDKLLDPLGITTEDIVTVHYELPMYKMFYSYGCFSPKTPDIIYRLETGYLVGEIKSNNHREADNRATKQLCTYSQILKHYSIDYELFSALGTGEPKITKCIKNTVKKNNNKRDKYANKRRNIQWHG